MQPRRGPLVEAALPLVLTLKKIRGPTRVQKPCKDAKSSVGLERAVCVCTTRIHGPPSFEARALDQGFEVLARRFFETAQSVDEGKRVLRAEQRHRPGCVVPEADKLSLHAHFACSI